MKSRAMATSTLKSLVVAHCGTSFQREEQSHTNLKSGTVWAAISQK